MKALLATVAGLMVLGSTAMASINDCPTGTWPVAQYDIHGNFLGYKCEKVNDYSAPFAFDASASATSTEQISCPVYQFPVAQYDINGNFLGYKCEGNQH